MKAAQMFVLLKFTADIQNKKYFVCIIYIPWL